MANVPFSLIWQCFDSLTNSPGQPEGGGVGGGGGRGGILNRAENQTRSKRSPANNTEHTVQILIEKV